jgi:hypothetical protein
MPSTVVLPNSDLSRKPRNAQHSWLWLMNAVCFHVATCKPPYPSLRGAAVYSLYERYCRVGLQCQGGCIKRAKILWFPHLMVIYFVRWYKIRRRCQRSRGLRRRSAAARLLRLWVQILPEAWMFVVCVVCCQVKVTVTSWSPVQRSPTECVASLCVIRKLCEWGGHGPLERGRGFVVPNTKKKKVYLSSLMMKVPDHVYVLG